MAKDKKPKAAKPDKKVKGEKGARKGGAGKVLFVLMIFLVTIWSTACLILPGMMPTLVALVTDRDREKALALTVGATNFAGCLPFVMQLWSMGQNFDNALKLMRDPMTWLVMYASAGIGYLIYMIVPDVVATVMAGSASGKIARLQKNLEELQRVWGSDVATDKKFDVMGDLQG
ncbi:MAG: hypothetical protein KBA75_00600 [Alphaproteobacteria bacterium]|nr:hypothetical protein [Alphaproteobacteria bacterium]